jgi:hypothetical protein
MVRSEASPLRLPHCEVDTQIVLDEIGITMHSGHLRTAITEVIPFIDLYVRAERGKLPEDIDPRLLNERGELNYSGLTDEVWKSSQAFKHNISWIGRWGDTRDEKLTISFGILQVIRAVQKQYETKEDYVET